MPVVMIIDISKKSGQVLTKLQGKCQNGVLQNLKLGLIIVDGCRQPVT